jgi:hypothetical protein
MMGWSEAFCTKPALAKPQRSRAAKMHLAIGD